MNVESIREDFGNLIETGNAGFFKKVPQYVAIAWIGWLADLIVSVYTSSGYLFRPVIPLAVKFLLGMSGFTVWLLVILLPAAIFQWIIKSAAKKNIAGSAVSMVLIGLAWFGLFCYIVSWTVYVRSGTFVNFEGAHFALWNPFQLMLHLLQVEEENLINTLIASCVLFVLLCVLLKYVAVFLRRFSPRPLIGLSAIAFAVGISAPFLAYASDLKVPKEIYDAKDRVYFTRTELYLYMLRYHQGPVSQIFFDVASAFEPGKEYIRLDPSLYTESKRIIPLTAYMDSVSAEQIKKYNVLHILIESLRADRLKALGAKRPSVPHIDELASRSTIFANAYAQSSHSDYADLCTLNSQYPLRSRVHHYYQLVTYPRVLIYDILKNLGYRTAIFSSQNENWGGMLQYLNTGNLDHIFHAETFQGETYAEMLDWGFAQKVRMGELMAGKVEDHFTVRAAMEWITRQPDTPFFIYLNLQSTHFPYTLPKNEKPTYTPYEINFPTSFISYPKENTHVMLNRYDNSLLYIDRMLGELFAFLELSGLLEKTIVIVSGDNGEAFNEHDSVTHASKLWNEVMNVPLVIHIPGQGHKQIRTPVEHIDIPPTVLHILGLPPHPSFQGKNMFTKTETGALHLLAQTNLATQDAIVDNGHKLIYDWRLKSYALYDLRHDPGETIDIARQKPLIVKRLRGKLEYWRGQQIWYYEHPKHHAEYYPPSFE